MKNNQNPAPKPQDAVTEKEAQLAAWQVLLQEEEDALQVQLTRAKKERNQCLQEGLKALGDRLTDPQKQTLRQRLEAEFAGRMEDAPRSLDEIHASGVRDFESLLGVFPRREAILIGSSPQKKAWDESKAKVGGIVGRLEEIYQAYSMVEDLVSMLEDIKVLPEEMHSLAEAVARKNGELKKAQEDNSAPSELENIKNERIDLFDKYGMLRAAHGVNEHNLPLKWEELERFCKFHNLPRPTSPAPQPSQSEEAKSASTPQKSDSSSQVAQLQQRDEKRANQPDTSPRR
ncbi:MAG: hypothetical protein K0R63_483 [Rickettsiales bacterium]|jgi:hypothetical protein|nr:hypothetical protein [Rickettsiales bacterium]